MSVHKLTLEQQLTADFMTVTPELAREWLGRNEGNRNLRNLKIAAFVRDILAGRFIITGEAIKFDWNGRLIDGQNRLHAIVKAGKAVTILVVRGLDPESQKVMDTGAKRSAGDALLMSGHHHNPHVLAATIRLLIAWGNGELSTAYSVAPEVTHSEILRFHNTHREALTVAVMNATRIYQTLGATPSPLAAAIFLTGRADPVESLRFFQEVYDLDLGGSGNPKATLYKRLQSLRDEKSVPAQQIYFILRAWNAWRDGQQLSVMKDRTAKGVSRMPEVK